MWRCEYDSPVGRLTLVAVPAGLRAIRWQGEEAPAEAVGDDDHPVLRRAVAELDEYFAGSRTSFTVPLDPVGTEFQLRAWLVLRRIPYGSTISYGEQAERLGDRRKARAVGAANSRNPLPIVVACHRVVGSGGALTGFTGGLSVKQWLLDFEHSRST